jgi:hypothetical protein
MSECLNFLTSSLGCKRKDWACLIRHHVSSPTRHLSGSPLFASMRHSIGIKEPRAVALAFAKGCRRR